MFSHHRKKDVSSVSGCSCALAVSDSAEIIILFMGVSVMCDPYISLTL